MKCNRLSINYSKTTFFIACLKRERTHLKTFSLKTGKRDLLQKVNGKYLGVIIDKDLKWNIHKLLSRPMPQKNLQMQQGFCVKLYIMSVERRYLFSRTEFKGGTCLAHILKWVDIVSFVPPTFCCQTT